MWALALAAASEAAPAEFQIQLAFLSKAVEEAVPEPHG